tara:strand:+ start:34929 stop:35591 length:663 start_codon:yes stop_codon:yes gene_type:complete
MKIICIIPARGGSKRIKNKNIFKINSNPLINLVIKKIYRSKYIKNFYVFTNDQSIKKSVEKLKKFKKISILSRSKESEKDIASTEILLDEINVKLDFDIAILLQITNPFINYKIIDSAIKKFIKMKYDSLLSVVPMKSFMWEKKGDYIKPKNYKIFERPRSQEINEYYLENGSFYIFKKSNYLKNKNRLGGKIGYFQMKKESIFELDDYSDLEIIKKLIE